MKKIVLVCGLIAGFITAAWMIVSLALYNQNENKDIENGMIYGYAAMILAFSLIFVGIKTFRDKHNNGIISFGKAFRIGLWITLIASTIYVIVWLIEYYYFIPDFGEKYTAHLLEKMRTSGATQAAIDKKATEMGSFNQMYKNPFFNALITYTEIIPVGLVISLISALFLKRRSKGELQTA